MEKILLALDARQMNTNVIEFACYIAKLAQSKLIGVFPEGVCVEGEKYIPGSGDATYGENDLSETNIRKAINKFTEACICRETSSVVHRDHGIPLSELVEESRFADLLIVDPVTSFSRSDRAIPSRVMKDLLLRAECPVLVAPYAFDEVNEIIFISNGTNSCLSVIRQFVHLFPSLAERKAILVNMRNANEEAIEKQPRMKEWLNAHFRDVELVALKGNTFDDIFEYLFGKKKAMVVIGSEEIEMLTLFFRSYQAHPIPKTINLPVFIGRLSKITATLAPALQG